MSTRQPSKATQPAPVAFGFSGADILKQAAIEQELAKSRAASRGVDRFWLPYGAETEIIILDNEPDLCAFYEYEFQLSAGDKTRTFEISTKPRFECPLEGQLIGSENAKPYFVQMYTILDLTPYTSKKGELVRYRRKLLPVKGAANIAEFQSKFISLKKKFGSLRGVKIRMARGEDNMSPRIGKINSLKDADGNDTLEYGFLTEAQLIKEFGHPAIISERDKKILVPENGYLQPYNYHEIFKQLPPDELRKKYHIGHPMGSRQDIAEIFDHATDSHLAEPGQPFSSADLLMEDDIPF